MKTPENRCGIFTWQMPSLMHNHQYQSAEVAQQNINGLTTRRNRYYHGIPARWMHLLHAGLFWQQRAAAIRHASACMTVHGAQLSDFLRNWQ